MPHLQDYEPSADHLAVHNAALQYMLLALHDDSDDAVTVLPAWPCSWDVDFRLHAPRNTTVELSFRDGRVANLTVTPSARTKAVHVAKCQDTR